MDNLLNAVAIMSVAAICLAILLITAESNDKVKYTIELQYWLAMLESLELNDIPHDEMKRGVKNNDDVAIFQVKARYEKEMEILMREVAGE